VPVGSINGGTQFIETNWHVLYADGPDVIICIYCYYYYHHHHQQQLKPLNTGNRYSPPTKRRYGQS